MSRNTGYYNIEIDSRRARRCREQRRRRQQLLLVCASIIMLAIGVYAVVRTVDELKKLELRAAPPAALTAPPLQEVVISPPPEATLLPEVLSPPPTVPPEESPEPGYDFSQPVPESAAVGDDYFDDAVFIGDSRTEGLIINCGLSNTTSYAHKGLMVDSVFSDDIINVDGVRVPVMTALETSSFKKVYIMLGINETGWPYNDIFIEKYGEIIDAIRAINPEAIIYVQQILPVTKNVSSSHRYIRNSKIDEFNSLLSEMAADKGVYYIDTAAAVSDQDGSLPEAAATDGIHLKKDYYIKWLDYLKTHTISE